MAPIRFRIHRLMFWVAFVAVNLAVFRSLFSTRSIDLLGAGLMTSILLQVAAFRAFRNQGRGRSYWLGFVGGGAVAALTYLEARSYPYSVWGSVWRTYLIAAEGLLVEERMFITLARVFGKGVTSD
jgi:hypothetical protein